MVGLTRRTFLQMAALVACSDVLRAAPAATLKAEVSARAMDGFVVANVRLHNPAGNDPVDVLITRGMSSGIVVRGQLGEFALEPEPVFDPQAMSRAAPRMIWRPVPAGGELDAGTMALRLPEGAGAILPGLADFTVTLDTYQGQLVLTASGVLVRTA